MACQLSSYIGYMIITYGVFLILSDALLGADHSFEICGIHVFPFIFSLIFNYLLTCIWITEMILHEDGVKIIYPTRLTHRKKHYQYSDIRKFELLEIRPGRVYRILFFGSNLRHIDIDFDDNRTVQETLLFVQSKGVDIEIIGDQYFKEKYEL